MAVTKTNTPSRPKKRSLKIEGHRTSISLENAFWRALRDVAGEQGRSVPALVADIDAKRCGISLSSAIRIHLLNHFRSRARSEIDLTGLD